ncbi:MAG: hypothetical protein LOD90_11725, partial [Symbiobacteriaceae bacterium]
GRRSRWVARTGDAGAVTAVPLPVRGPFALAARMVARHAYARPSGLRPVDAQRMLAVAGPLPSGGRPIMAGRRPARRGGESVGRRIDGPGLRS